MAHVDALSRYPVVVNTVSANIKQTQEANAEVQNLKQRVADNTVTGYSVSNGVLYRQHLGRDLVVIPGRQHNTKMS